MPEPTDPSLRTLLSELEECWRELDEVCATLTPRDWSRRHRPDRSVADLPYHLAYFDRELIADALLRGEAVPDTERHSLRTMAEVHAWHVAYLARRPATTTPEQSMVEMRASRARIRNASGVLSGVDLDRPVWCPLPGQGWQTVRSTLALCLAHTRSHLAELRQQVHSVATACGSVAD